MRLATGLFFTTALLTFSTAFASKARSSALQGKLDTSPKPELRLTEEEAGRIRKLKNETVSKLIAEKFFRSASCREIADAFLREAGLPALGQKTTVKGRGAFDRAKQGEELPVLSDEVSGNERFKIQMSSSGGKWEVHLKRDRGGEELTETVVTFAVRSEKAPVLCEAESIRFKVIQRKKQGLEIAALEPGKCLDLFLLAETPRLLAERMSPAAYQFLKKDCSVALRYVSDPRSL